MKTLIYIYIIVIALLISGWVQCIIKAVKCNWEPIGKAEVVYIIGSFVPPVGAIIGWCNIEDK